MLVMYMLEINALSIQLGEFSFTDLNLNVKDGEYCIILGPTGAGKTILLETIAGIHYPKTGRILLNGKDITHTSPESRGIGMVYQDYMLFPHMTVGENIGFGLKERGVSKPERDAAVQKIAATFGISHLLERHPKTLSGGEPFRGVNSSEPRSPGHFSCDPQFFFWMNLFPLWIRSRVSVSEMNSR